MANSAYLIYHNPRCSKSRQTLELLTSRGIEPVEKRYLETPPTVEEIEGLLDLLDRDPREIMRRHESEFKELNLADPLLDHQTLVQAIHDNPRLLERPIVVKGNRAVIGRPPENVLALIDD